MNTVHNLPKTCHTDREYDPKMLIKRLSYKDLTGVGNSVDPLEGAQMGGTGADVAQSLLKPNNSVSTQSHMVLFVYTGTVCPHT